MTTSALPLVLHATRSSSVLNQLLVVVVASVLMTVSAKVQVPFWPVPMTMQTAMVLVLGMALGPRLGPAAIAMYLVQGALGLPVFAGTPEKGLGLAYMVGPTGGYLLGFLLAAALCGQAAARGFDRHWPQALLTATAGMAVIYACGLAWLSTLIGWDKAVRFGAMPFLLGDVLKILLVMATLPIAWRMLGRDEQPGNSPSRADQ